MQAVHCLSDVELDDCRPAVPIKLALRTRAPSPTASIRGRQVRRQVDVRQLPTRIEVQIRPLQRHKRERGAVTVVDSVRVGLNRHRPRQDVPALAAIG